MTDSRSVADLVATHYSIRQKLVEIEDQLWTLERDTLATLKCMPEGSTLRWRLADRKFRYAKSRYMVADILNLLKD